MKFVLDKHKTFILKSVNIIKSDKQKKMEYIKMNSFRNLWDILKHISMYNARSKREEKERSRMNI